MDLSLLIPDTHRPFHDRKAYNLMLQVAVDLKPKELVILGDYADFYSVSSHAKDPRLPHLLEDEVLDVTDGLSEIDVLLPTTKKFYIEGNHEFRLERYLCDKAPALFGVTSIEYLFEFNRRPLWTFIPYGPSQRHRVGGSKLIARHEPLASSAKATASKALCSMVYGHIHRIEESHIVGLEGTNHVVFSVGWLGNAQHKVFEYVKTHHQWQHGFGLVWTEPKTGLFYHQKIHILENYSCLVNGKLYKA